jgi:hypothetical protein
MLKINIEHGDVGVAAAVAAIVENALAQHGFTNVKGKIVMVYQEVKRDAAGSVVPSFGKVNQLSPLVDPAIELRPKMYTTELMDARIAYGYPVIVDWMKADRPDVFASPVLIDTGIESTPYQEQLKAFKEGKDAAC